MISEDKALSTRKKVILMNEEWIMQKRFGLVIVRKFAISKSL